MKLEDYHSNSKGLFVKNEDGSFSPILIKVEDGIKLNILLNEITDFEISSEKLTINKTK